MGSSLNQYGDIATYKKGHVLFTSGSSSLYLYLVVSGEVTLFDGDQKRLVPVEIIEKKDFVGHETIFNDSSRRLSAILSEDAEVFLIKKSEIKKVLKICPDWVADIMKILSDRLESTNEVIYDNKMIDSTTRDGRLNMGAEALTFYKKAIAEFQALRDVGA